MRAGRAAPGGLHCCLARLGLSARLAGVVATGCRSPRAAQALALQAGVCRCSRACKPDARVPRARERGMPPPAVAFAALAAVAGGPAA